MPQRMTPRIALVIIALLFILPLAVAWLMYSGTIDFKPTKTRNLGELVQPPVAVELDELLGPESGAGSLTELSGHWIVVHVLAEPCDDSCLQAVAGLRQVHRAAGRNQDRIRLLLLSRGRLQNELTERLLQVYPEFIIAGEPPLEVLDALDDIAGQADSAGATYLADPLGNIMLYYEAGPDPNFLKKDLKRLLTWSKLDEQS